MALSTLSDAYTGIESDSASGDELGGVPTCPGPGYCSDEEHYPDTPPQEDTGVPLVSSSSRTPVTPAVQPSSSHQLELPDVNDVRNDSTASLLVEIRRLGLENSPAYHSVTRRRFADGRVDERVNFNLQRVQCVGCQTWFASEVGYRLHLDEDGSCSLGEL